MLDTHVAIGALTSPKALTKGVRELIADQDNVVFVSAVSILEIAIKFPLGKRTAPPFSGSDALRHFRSIGFSLLDVTPEHAAAVETLPMLHADPFDRLQAAQALIEPLRLVTRDPKVAAYSGSAIKF